MPERYAVVRHRSSFAAASFIILFIVFVEAVDQRQVVCSQTCVAENCNTIGIRYGKYCGVGWTGCPGEKPCDDLDACCKIHDECVERKVQVVFGSGPTVTELTPMQWPRERGSEQWQPPPYMKTSIWMYDQYQMPREV